ncbi:MAG: hypothetical protein JJU37_05220 [Balneolaceae bacterium]|nr:hypothetical protein [Balneolaceae bacterium]
MKLLIKLLSIVLFPFIVGLSMPIKKSPVIMEIINPDHLDGPFTGGFGELTCHSCHFDYDLNMDGGRLKVEGLKDSFERGKSYEITVSIKSDHLENGGFQMTSRFQDGTQAGEFNWDGNHVMLTPSISDEVYYLQHSETGTRPTGDREVTWTFFWNSPNHKSDQKVVFNVAANAGNDDDSAFGDWIYVQELTVVPK